MRIEDIDQLIQAVCPIDGCNSNGEIWFKPEATAQQKAAARAIMAANLGNSTPSKSEFIAAVHAHIVKTAQSRGYDSDVSCASYATDPHLPFSAEASAFIPWRSSVWLYCFTEWAKFEAGQRAFTTPEAFIAELPGIVWPT